MNYKQLTEKKKVEIDTLLSQGYSMRKIGEILNISHSTVSRYKSRRRYRKKFNINDKYPVFINFIYNHYDRRHHSIEVCVYLFKKKYAYAPSVSVQQVYNWIKEGKIEIAREDICYKKRKKKKYKSGMMRHLEWNLENKTVLPIRLRPKYIEKREEIGHLEIDSIIGKRNENKAIISIVDRCSRKVWLIKAEYTYEYYTSNLIYDYIIKKGITVRSITTDNGGEFNTMGIAAKKLGVKLYKCDPYCSFQRGSNERMNAIIRRWIPKGESLKMKPQIYLDDICFQINTMPRKIFDFKTSSEIELNKF